MKDLCCSDYNERTGKYNNIIFSIPIAILLYCVYTVLSLIMIFPDLLRKHGLSLDDDQLADYMININKENGLITKASLVGVIIGIIVCVIWYYNGYIKKEKQNGTYESVLPKLTNVKFLVFLFLSGLACFAFAMPLRDIASLLFPDKANNLLIDIQIFEQTKPLYFFIAVFLDPIFIEMGFRGIILKRSKKAFGLIGCIIINTLIFVFYYRNPISFICSIPFSILITFIAFMYNSIIPGIIIQAFTTLLSFLFDFSYIGKFDTIVWIIAFIVFGGLAFWTGKDLFAMSDGFYYTDVSFRLVQKEQKNARVMSQTYWVVSLTHKKLVDTALRNSSFTEKTFLTKESTEKWLIDKGFVFGKNANFGDDSEPQWFHHKDNAVDFVSVKLYKRESYETPENRIDDRWVDDLGNRQQT